jgi:hypothetical protein
MCRTFAQHSPPSDEVLRTVARVDALNTLHQPVTFELLQLLDDASRRTKLSRPGRRVDLMAVPVLRLGQDGDQVVGGEVVQ